MSEEPPPIISVSLNPAVDRILEVPGLTIGGHVRGRLLEIQPAGKAVNVARILGTLGMPCILTGFVGAGERDHFRRSFEKTPVRLEMFEGREPTRENITLIDPEQNIETHIRDIGFSLSEDELERLAKKLYILSTPGAYVVFAGSLPPAMEAHALRKLLAVCRDRQVRLVLDSSGPGLEPLRSGEPLWLVKPNRNELGELVGLEAASEDQVQTAALALRKHVENVVVTAGEEGAYLFSAEGAWHARPNDDPAAVVNTVGCGDALLAGFIHAHASGSDLAECLRCGVAVGTAATRKVRAGVVDLADVEACYRRADVSPLG
jgi:1-phosphofructokinase